MPQNVWTEDENVNMMQLEDKEFNLCDFALFMSVMKSELLEEKGSVSENTQKMLLQETDKEVKVKSFAPRQIQRRLFAALVTLSRKVF